MPRPWKPEYSRWPDPIVRFWSQVNKTPGCWLWTGTTQGEGRYGAIYWNGRLAAAHRVSWEIHFGDIGTWKVCHRCDTTLCVRPDHLFLGTQQDNVHDMMAKGRWGGPRGEAVATGKLCAEDIPRIRQLRHEGLSQQAIADQFNVSQPAISAILRGKTWKHI